MKKNYLKSFCARCLTLLVLALLSTNLAWGETWTYTVTKESSPTLNSDNPATVNGALWSIVMGEKVGSPSANGAPVNAQKSSGWQWGDSGSKYWKSYTLSTDYFKDKNVKSVKVNFMNNGSKLGTMTVTQGSTTIGTASETFGQVWTDLTANTTAGTGGTLSIKYEVAQASFIHSISVTYEESTTPTEAYTVTFNPGTNGTCSTTSLTEASAGAGITLPECTANDGYVFKGWSTTEGGTTPNAGVADETYKPSSNCTLYAVYNALYTVTIETPENGSLVVKNGGVPVTSGSAVEDGTTLTIEATPNEGYQFKNWQAIDASTHTYTKGTTYSINAHDVTFKANFDEISKYTINYMVNGVNTNPQENVYEGTALVFPAVGELGGKVFVGWSESVVAETNDKPTLVETAGLTASKDKTYYAVFANKGGNDFYKLVTSLTENNKYLFVSSNETGSAYALDASKIGTNSSATSSAKSVTIDLVGSDKVITEIDTDLEFKYNSSGDVDLVCSDSGEKLVINGDGFRKATSNYKAYWDDEKGLYGTNSKGTTYYYVNYNSSSNAFKATSSASSRVYAYEKMEAAYSGYCTSVEPTTQNVTISSVGWATACLPFNATVSDNATAYYVTTSGSTLNKIEANVIPAGEGVLLKSNEGGAATVTFTETAVAADEIEANDMLGSVVGETFSDPDFKYYILANDKNLGLGFYFQVAEGVSANCAAGKAVLAVPTKEAGAKTGFPFDEEPTGISESMVNGQSTAVYNLNGMKVDKNYNGIVIMNGKKYLNK